MKQLLIILFMSLLASSIKCMEEVVVEPVVDQQEAFIKAVDDGDVPQVIRLCGNGFDLSVPINRNLISRSSNDDFLMVYDRNFLNFAIAKGQEPIVEALLDQGVDKNQVLVLAAFHNKRKLVHFLIAKGTDVNARTNAPGELALHAAASGGNTDLCLLLLEEDANLYSTDSKGYTALHVAAKNNHSPVVTFLLAEGMDPSIAVAEGEAKGETPLHLAAIQDSIYAFKFLERRFEVVKILIDAGADVNARTSSGDTPVHYMSSFLGCG